MIPQVDRDRGLKPIYRQPAATLDKQVQAVIPQAEATESKEEAIQKVPSLHENLDRMVKPKVTVTERFIQFLAQTTTQVVDGFSILTYHHQKIPLKKIEEIIQVVNESVELPLHNNRILLCESEANHLAKVLIDKGFDSQLFISFGFFFQTRDALQAYQQEGNAPWSLKGYVSPCRETHHVVAYVAIQDLHVAIDVTYGPRVKGQAKAQLMIANSKEELAQLVGSRYLSRSVYSAPVDSFSVAAFHNTPQEPLYEAPAELGILVKA